MDYINNTDDTVVIKGNSIRVKSNSKSKASNYVGVVSILPGIQVKIGRGIDEFVSNIRKTTRGLGVQRTSITKELSVWKVMILKEDDFEKKYICSINAINNIIVSVTFNHKLNYDKEYRSRNRLSMLHMLTAGKVGELDNEIKALKAISIITGEHIKNLETTVRENQIIVKTDIEGLKNQYRYTFFKDPGGYYNMLSVAIAEEVL